MAKWMNWETISMAWDINIEIYPENPNGSIAGIAGVTNFSGTVTIMMTHPERDFLADHMSWVPKAFEKYNLFTSF